MSFLRTFLSFFFLALELVILGRVLMSWVDPGYRNPLGRFLFDTTEPLLRPIRSMLPQTGMLDLSPIIAFLVIGVIAGALGLR